MALPGPSGGRSCRPARVVGVGSSSNPEALTITIALAPADKPPIASASLDGPSFSNGQGYAKSAGEYSQLHERYPYLPGEQLPLQ
jgi:hypothetical protein